MPDEEKNEKKKEHRLADESLLAFLYHDLPRLFSDWCRETTMHGVLHLNKDVSPFFWQRIVWGCLTLFAMGLTLYQVSTRLILYYSYPVAVDITLNFRRNAEFPAVTICNTNRYRTTAISSTGFSEFWLEYWDPSLDFDFADYEELAEDLDVLEMMKFWAHQKEDMIYSCNWHGGHGNCGPQNFTLAITDYGLCYTFNSDKRNPELSTLTGSGYGLQLVINVEQYEYSRGPENTAGIKMLVHPPNEIPRVRDLGTYVPVGYEALLGIEGNLRKRLPSPYGSCGQKKLVYYDEYSPAACYLDCLIEFVVKECGCRDLFMPEIYPGYPPVCELKEWVTCALTAEERFYESDIECGCPEACTTSHYSSSVSYAAISKLNAEAIANQDLKKAAKVKKKFELARNTYARQNKKQSDHDRKVLLNLLGEMLKVENELQVVIYGIREVEQEASNIIKSVMDVTDDYLFAVVNFTNYFQTAIMVQIVEAEMFIADSCFTSYSSYMKSSFEINFELFWNSYVKSFKEGSAQERFQAEGPATANLANLLIDISKLVGLFQETLKALDLLRFHLFENLMENFPMLIYVSGFKELKLELLEKYQETRNCVLDMEAGANDFLKVLQGDMFNVSTPDQNIKEQYEYFRKHGTAEVPECSKVLHVLRIELQHIPTLIMQKIAKPFEEEIKILLIAQSSLLQPFSIKGELDSIYSNALAIHGDMREWFNTFFLWQGTKLQLATNMSSFQIKHFEQEIQLLVSSFSEAMESLAHSDEEFLSQVLLTFNFMEENLFMKNYFSLPMKRKVKFEELPQVLKNVETGMHHIKGRASVWLKQITTIIEFTTDSFVKVASDLQKFKSETQTDATFHRENFLQVNVYYTDFREERVQQRAGYDFNGLMADMGGSLSLFLGASILTVIELVDFLLETVLKKWLRPDLIQAERRFDELHHSEEKAQTLESNRINEETLPGGAWHA